jgi:hypothetical protein
MRRNRIPFFKNRKMEKVVTRGVQRCPINSVIKRPSDLREIKSHATAAAIRDCNVQAGKYKQYLWGDYEIDAYRACMAQRGQQE